MARQPVEAVFFHAVTKAVHRADVRVPTGSSGWATAARIACQDYAWDNRFTHWASPRSYRSDTEWDVFKCMGRSERVFLGSKPTKEAAEMWLVHLGK